MISVPTTQLCPYPVEAATDSIYKLMGATVFQEKFIHNRQQVRFVLQAIICKLLVYTTPSLVPLTKLKITQLISQLCAKSQLTTEVGFVFFFIHLTSEILRQMKFNSSIVVLLSSYPETRKKHIP